MTKIALFLRTRKNRKYALYNTPAARRNKSLRYVVVVWRGSPPSKPPPIFLLDLLTLSTRVPGVQQEEEVSSLLLPTAVFLVWPMALRKERHRRSGGGARGSRGCRPGCAGGLPEEFCRGSDHAAAHHGHSNAVSIIHFLLC